MCLRQGGVSPTRIPTRGIICVEIGTPRESAVTAKSQQQPTRKYRTMKQVKRKKLTLDTITIAWQARRRLRVLL
jgi:hypothetical protein